MIKLNRPEDCCGCTACANICAHGAITMTVDAEGFAYPHIDETLCTDCGLCDRVCPIIARKTMDLGVKTYKCLYAGRLKDEAALMRSASGGAFWAIASDVIADGGVVFGAVYDADMRVVHRGADTLEGCQAFQGSKYSQSDTFQAYREVRAIVRSGRKVLFTGTPCQVDGLLRFLIKKYDNLLTMDVVCHAVPSPKIFSDYISLVERRLKGRLVYLNMRDKSTRGWSHVFTYRYDMADGRSLIDQDKTVNWGRLFFSKLIDRPSCHECKYTNLNRASDITVADFWDDDNTRPDLRSSRGTSLLMANTDAGKAMLIRMAPGFHLAEITELQALQPCLKQPTKADPRRAQFWADYSAEGFSYVYRKYFDDSAYQKFKNIVKKILSALGLWKPKR
ncbi:MAG: Coenzyme F420 hydrogenase/dehydrogenase, beta subunit C-terminal domain [Candidatus Amulumruptor sp.]